MARTIDRHERDKLWLALEEFERDVEMLGVPLAGGDRDEFLAARERVDDTFALLEDIGWQFADPREHFELAIRPDRLERVLARIAESCEGVLRDEVVRMRQVDPEHSPEDHERWLEETRGAMDGDLETLLVVSRLRDGASA
ncbi:MAG TPA: hypothetical protein VD790_11395 [Thermoleophilaceae bacterium]|nr:hypothetical protein [Thermoleophilaceae bacterium]